MKKIKLLLVTIFYLSGPVTVSANTNISNVNTVIDSGYFESFDKVKIYYEVAGTGDPVVLIHGFTGNAASWKRIPVYQELLDKGHKVIIVDLRGNGRSEKPHDSNAYANDAEAKDIMGLVTNLGIDQYKLVGYSRGSIIVARLLILDKRIASAVMGGMGADFTNPQWPRRIMFYKALMGEPNKELEPMIRRVKETGLDQLALAYQQKEQPSASATELAGIKQKILVVCGNIDADNGSSKELVKLIPNASHAEVPGDHGGALRSPEFAHTVSLFLK